MARTQLLAALAAAALLTLSLAAERNIPATDDNQDYFALTQALFAGGTKKQSSCGSDRAEIEACIKDCNSPGLQERSGCCCVALPNRQFFVGIRGGCRYRQQLLNFSTSLIYSSTPAGSSRPYFDEVTCDPSRSNPTDAVCECSLSWEIPTDVLAMTSPLATPSASLTPGLSPSGTPSASPSMLTPEPSMPSASMDPSPLPSESAAPMASIVPPPVPTQIPTETPEPTEDFIPPGPTDPEDITPTPSVDSSTPGPDETPDTTDETSAPSPPVVTPTPDGDTNTDGDGGDDDGGVCVEESFLTAMGVPRAHLVHTTGIKQRVLCPPGSLPCGTSKHKIRRQGVSMSYSRYCREFVRCEEREAVVNSVYTHLWEETQHDDDVRLTMYDVSYPESAQVVLHSVMSAGRRALRRLKRSSYLA